MFALSFAYVDASRVFIVICFAISCNSDASSNVLATSSFPCGFFTAPIIPPFPCGVGLFTTVRTPLFACGNVCRLVSCNSDASNVLATSSFPCGFFTAPIIPPFPCRVGLFTTVRTPLFDCGNVCRLVSCIFCTLVTYVFNAGITVVFLKILPIFFNVSLSFGFIVDFFLYLCVILKSDLTILFSIESKVEVEGLEGVGAEGFKNLVNIPPIFLCFFSLFLFRFIFFI